MSGEEVSFSRAGRLAWAGIAAFLSTLAGLGLIPLAIWLQTCGGCGSSLEGTICDGTYPGGCGTYLAITVAALVVLTGLCVLFGVNASSAYRARRGVTVTSLLRPEGRSPGVWVQVGSLTALLEGGILAAAGALAPILGTFCLEGCPPPYLLRSVPLDLVVVGVLLAVAGSCGFLLGRDAAVRTVPGGPGSRSPTREV
jgi:hypothetical protein